LAALSPSDEDIFKALRLIQPRAWIRWNTTLPLPCAKFHNKETSSTGLFLVKIPKTASSTAATITMRMASQIGLSRNVSLCKFRAGHDSAVETGYAGRDRSKSILWSLVRDPTARCISQFFHFTVSRDGQNSSDENFQQATWKQGTLQMRHLAISVKDKHKNPQQWINSILNTYDFLGVTERLDESVVALQMLLGLQASDMLYFRYVQRVVVSRVVVLSIQFSSIH
jgi:hypothetical protein